MTFNTISVIGLGYIGLPTAAIFSSRGIDVFGVDTSSYVVEKINQGKVHIVEPDLDNLVENSVKAGKLRAGTEPECADAFIISVPTPFIEIVGGDPQPDLTYVQAACNSIAPVLRKGNLVVLESTSPVGATEKVRDWLSELRPDLLFPDGQSSTSDIYIAHCPERVLPGKIIIELLNNDRIIGGISPKCSRVAAELYEAIIDSECFLTDARTAELTKLTENASRDLQIAFANELSLICDRLNINVWELIRLANKHPRVNILNPGPGVGGHCIAVDPWFTISTAPEQARLHRLARQVNNLKPSWVKDKIQSLSSKHSNARVILFGLSYKPDIDDFRESPALKIAYDLQKVITNNLSVVEPYASSDILSVFDVIDQSEVDFTTDVCILLVAHSRFQKLPKPNIYLDLVGIWDSI